MLTIGTLASGSSGNALLAIHGNTRILIDAGVSLRRLTAHLKTLSLTPADLTAVLITHEHTDHVSGLPMLFRETALPVFASAGTACALVRSFPALAGNLRGFEAGSVFPVGGVEVESFSTPHDSADSVGYVLRAGGVKASVATDLGEMTESVFDSLSGSDFLLLEANHDVDMLRSGGYPPFLQRRILGRRGHLSNLDAARALAGLVRTGVRHVVLGHLSDKNNRPDLALAAVSDALAREDLLSGLTLHVAPRAAPCPVFSAHAAY